MDSPEGQRLLIAASFGLAANLLFFRRVAYCTYSLLTAHYLLLLQLTHYSLLTTHHSPFTTHDFFSLFRYRARVVVATKRAMERLALPTDPALVQVQRARSSDHVSGMQYMCHLLYCSASLQTMTL